MPSPCFWYNTDAQVACALYLEAFPGAEITSDNGFLCELSFGDSRLLGMNGGPAYRPNKTLSIYAELADASAVEFAFAKLTTGGQAKVYMPLATYAWSAAYAWIEDAWGVNWQLTVVGPETVPVWSPALMFTDRAAGRAEEALKLYAKRFAPCETLTLTHYPSGPDAGNVMHAQLQLADNKLVLLDSSAEHAANFSEGGSLMVLCDTQAEIDGYWQGLIANGGSAGRCGWCKDGFGVSWQIVPRQLSHWLSNPVTAKKVGEAMQGMGKLVIADLAPKKSADVWAALRGV